VMSPTDSATVLDVGIGARGLGRLWRKKGTKVDVEVQGIVGQMGRRERAMSGGNPVMGQPSSVYAGSLNHDRPRVSKVTLISITTADNTQHLKIFLVASRSLSRESRMGQPQAKKRRKHSNGNHPLHRTRNYGRDIDQIHADLSQKTKTLLQNTVIDEDKPGLGVHYCLECARWFVDETTLAKHRGSKVHKRRLTHP